MFQTYVNNIVQTYVNNVVQTYVQHYVKNSYVQHKLNVYVYRKICWTYAASFPVYNGSVNATFFSKTFCSFLVENY